VRSTINSLLLGIAFISVAAGQRAPALDCPARVWGHYCPWNATNNFSHSRRDFPLGMGLETWPGMTPRAERQSQKDRIWECMIARDAGIDAFALDILVSRPLKNWLHVLDGFLKAAETIREETGQEFLISPCLDGAAAREPEDLAAYLDEMLSGRTESPAWPRLNGRPVVWTYAGTRMSADRWRRTLELLENQGHSPVFILDANSLFGKVKPQAPGDDSTSGLPVEELDSLAGLPVALYPFRTDFDRQTMERCLDYLRTHHPESLAARLSIGTIWPGYWSLGTGWFVDPEATGRIRETFDQARSSQWLTVTTWNDYFETTHFKPTIGFGTGRLDLLHALLAQWRGDQWPTETRLYLWQPNEVQVGDAITGEAIAMVPAGGGPIEITVSQCDADGKAFGESTMGRFGTPGVHAIPYSFHLDAMPPTHLAYLLLSYRTDGGERASELSRPICVWPAGYHPLATRRGTMWRSDADTQRRGAPELAIGRDDGVPLRLAAEWSDAAFDPGSQLYVRQNFNLIHFPFKHTQRVVYEMDKTYGQGRPRWEVYRPVPPGRRWGFFDTVAVMPDGQVRWSDPVWVPPVGDADLQCAGAWSFDETEGAVAHDASPYGHNGSLKGETLPQWVAPGKAGASCLSFDGTSSYVNVPGGRFPEGEFTVSAWVSPQLADSKLDGSQYIYCEINGSVLFSLDADLRLHCMRSNDGKWAAVTGKTALPRNEWSHVAVTYDLQHLRLYLNGKLEGETPCTGTRRSNVTAIGCNPFPPKSGFFRGLIDEVRVEAQALTPEALLP